MTHPNTLAGMLALNTGWTDTDRARLELASTAAGVTEWTYWKSGWWEEYVGTDEPGRRLLLVIRGRMRVLADHSGYTVPLLEEAGLDLKPRPANLEPWFTHEILTSRSGGTDRAGGKPEQAPRPSCPTCNLEMSALGRCDDCD
jgi:hypothetical protein